MIGHFIIYPNKYTKHIFVFQIQGDFNTGNTSLDFITKGYTDIHLSPWEQLIARYSGVWNI